MNELRETFHCDSCRSVMVGVSLVDILSPVSSSVPSHLCWKGWHSFFSAVWPQANEITLLLAVVVTPQVPKQITVVWWPDQWARASWKAHWLLWLRSLPQGQGVYPTWAPDKRVISKRQLDTAHIPIIHNSWFHNSTFDCYYSRIDKKNETKHTACFY